MNRNIEEWLFVAMYRKSAPEHRTTQKLYGEAYSGPEQRQRVEYRLEKDFRPRMRVAEPRQLDTALAA